MEATLFDGTIFVLNRKVSLGDVYKILKYAFKTIRSNKVSNDQDLAQSKPKWDINKKQNK